MRKMPKNKTKAVSSTSDVNRFTPCQLLLAKERAWLARRETSHLWRDGGRCHRICSRDTETLLAHATLDKIDVVGGIRIFAAALRGDAPARHNDGILADAHRGDHVGDRPGHDSGCCAVRWMAMPRRRLCC